MTTLEIVLTSVLGALSVAFGYTWRVAIALTRAVDVWKEACDRWRDRAKNLEIIVRLYEEGQK